MKLFYSTNSPYARKCRVVMLEKKLENKIELINVNPLENPAELLAVNPLGTVPALVTDDGLHLCESPAICEYLDSLSPENPLMPPPEFRICVLAVTALADGIMDAAVSCVLESRRPEDKRYPLWVQRKEAAIMRAIAKCAGISWDVKPTLGTIGLAVALAYVSFRLPHLPWRKEHPKLAEWLDAFSQRPSMAKTKPIA